MTLTPSRSRYRRHAILRQGQPRGTPAPLRARKRGAVTGAVRHQTLRLRGHSSRLSGRGLTSFRHEYASFLDLAASLSSERLRDARLACGISRSISDGSLLEISEISVTCQPLSKCYSIGIDGEAWRDIPPGVHYTSSDPSYPAGIKPGVPILSRAKRCNQ